MKDSIKEERMGGVYSLMKDKWIKKPERKDFIPDEKLIRSKAEKTGCWATIIAHIFEICIRTVLLLMQVGLMVWIAAKPVQRSLYFLLRVQTCVIYVGVLYFLLLGVLIQE